MGHTPAAADITMAYCCATLQLLWEEYAKGNELAFKYTSFCVKYREWTMGLKRSMRQTHIAGEKLFVDYAGQTVPIIDATTGEITKAQIFVATFGASNYTFACATARQTTADWIGAQVLALEFFGGVPRLVVPDQTRSLIKNPGRYDPQNNRLYEEFAAHYGCALLAARPAHPRDKPNDNALAESKNASMVRKHMGYAHIPKKHAEPINIFYQKYFTPWLNLHRPCMFASSRISDKGKVVKVYKHGDVKTPLEALVKLHELGLVKFKTDTMWCIYWHRPSSKPTSMQHRKCSDPRVNCSPALSNKKNGLDGFRRPKRGASSDLAGV